MSYLIATITAEELARLFRDNIWKLYKLPESVISDKEPQFVARLIKELNKILEIEMKLSTAFHPQTDRQKERMNQELEQYLRMYIDHRQNNQLEWLATAEFAFNNKVHIATNLSLLRVNYGQKLKIGFEIRKKGKYTKVEKFIKEIKEIYKKVKVVLRKLQEEMKKYVDKNKKKVVEYKVRDRVLLSTKNLTQQIRNRETKKLIEKFIRLYKIKKMILENIVELELMVSIKIHLVVNMSRIVIYQKKIEG